MRTKQDIAAALFLGIIFLLTIAAQAQWPGDPAENMVISNLPGSETLPKIAVTSDGGCYISWWNNTSGNYDVYMQRLDANGDTMWADNGLLISTHPQDTWLTDYDLAVDHQDHAIVVVNDIRAGADRDIYAYRISPSGEFVWGPDGLTVSANDGFEPDPRVTVTNDGNIVFAWQEENVIHLRKVTPAGVDFWNPPTITLTSTYGYSIPRVTPADSDGFILQLFKWTGPYGSPIHLYVHKYDASGNELWGADGEAVSTAGGFAPWMEPDIVTDGAGGGYSYWYDSRTGLDLHAYAQHVLANGTMAWTPNGVIVSTAGGEYQRTSALVRVPGATHVMLFYEATDPNQNLVGVYGQMINDLGQRQWTNNGIAFVPRSSQSRLLINVSEQDGGAAVTYLERPVGDQINARVKAFRVDTTGAPVWDPSPVVMTTTLSDKGYLQAKTNVRGQVIAVWEDKRSDSDGDIYLQNVNPDASFGPYETSVNEQAPNLPGRFTIYQNYPNPFNAVTTLSYALPRGADVIIEIYDVLGRRAQTLKAGHSPAGYHSVTWDAAEMPTGVYFYSIRAGECSATGKMLLLK